MAENPGQNLTGGPGGGAALDRQRLTATNANSFIQPSGPTTVNALAGPNGSGQESTPIVGTSTLPPSTQQQQDQTNGQNATSSIAATLNSLGLGGMVSWATGLAYSLAGQGIDSSDIVNTITSQMNNPTDSNGQVDQGALAAFNSALPGFNQLIANTGQNGSPGSTPAQAIANYINYSTQIGQFEQQALIPGTISPDVIGQLWAGQVSTSEVSQRITDATVTATSAPKQVQDYLANNYGMTPAALTSYYLNPQNTMQQITTNMNSGMAGGEASITGFDKNMSVAQSQALGAFLANGASSGSSTQIGGVNQVSASNANAFFNESLGSDQSQAGGSIGTLAQAAGMESALPGQSGAVSEDTLLAAGEGNATALATVGQAHQARTASSRGGGGAATTSNGAVGLGFSQS